jgi:hypothetical protein
VRRASFLLLALVGCSSSESASTSGTSDASIIAADSSAADATSSDAHASADAGPDAVPGCLPGMVRIGALCVDTYEAYVVEVDAGAEYPHDPHYVLPDGGVMRAKTAAGVIPQGYISQIQAAAACKEAGKRLCTATEFATFCRGGADSGAYYPYGGTTHMPGYCNEGKGSSMVKFFGNNPSTWTYAEFNDPRLNDWDGGLAATGTYPHCVSPFGVYDCVGNLHEWGEDPPDQNGHGRFRGGFYGDAELNGPGCLYVTSAHEIAYHDYSTGFRCCMDAQ